MDQIENTTVDTAAADQQDAFLSGWEGDEFEVETANQQQTDTAEEQVDDAATEEEGSETEPVEAEETVTAVPEAEAEPEAKEEQTWSVKHMGEEKTFKASDITPELLQKGMDYDRIRSKYDEAKPVLEFVNASASRNGMSVAEYLKQIRTEAKKATGLSQEEASRAVELEDREAAVSAKEAAQQAEEAQQNDREARINANLAEFKKAFPDEYEQAVRDPQTIPQSVWDDVNGGEMSLASAYAKYKVADAEAKAQAAEERAAAEAANRRNSQRSTGSQKSAGSDHQKKDAFLAGWNS